MVVAEPAGVGELAWLAGSGGTGMRPDALDRAVLPEGVRARFIEGVNGLLVHLLEAGFEQPGRPLVLLLHGFPEIAYSWRKVMGPLAAAGYHVVAPDNRGYGRTTGGEEGFDVDLSAFVLLTLVRDMVALVAALGAREVALVAGHDFGSSVAASCALARPDVFRRLAMMSAPIAGPPGLPLAGPNDPSAALAGLVPPRKHYQWYYSTRAADADMCGAPQGLAAFLRAYFHQKSADWAGNAPHPLASTAAEDLGELPSYYVMPLHATMAEAVVMPSAEEIARCRWLREAELAVYVTEYARTGFQGGLNWYRARTSGLMAQDLALFSGRAIDVPSCFFAGAQDWGTYQKSGDFERMQSSACSDMRMCELIDGAGHWLQQEQPDALLARLLAFMAD